jgi:hypothetical protein
MFTIDSLKMQFPLDCIRGFDSSPDIYTETTNSRGLHKYGCTRYAPGFGGNKKDSAVIDVSAKQITFNLSAKILADSYLQGITTDTIEQAVSRALSISRIDADPCIIIESSKVLSMDITNNLWLPYPNNHKQHIEVIDTLQAAKMNQRFSAVPYRERGNIGLVYNGQHKSEKNRQIFYYKQIEMGKQNKSNRAFFDT